MLLLFFKEHPSHSALCCDISVELSPFAVKSMFWLRYGPITSQEITYPDLVVARIVSVMNGDFTIRRRDGNENVQNNNRFSRQNNNFALASHFFVHFFAVFCTTTTKNCLILLFMEDVNRPRRNFIPVSLNLNMVQGFAYIWRTKWAGIIAIKTERTQIQFWSDVFAAFASSYRKVLNECRAPALSWAFACLLFLFHKDYFRILYKKYDLSEIKIFQNNSLFHPEMTRRPFFWFKDTKIQVN